jgi:hypothetical protein
MSESYPWEVKRSKAPAEPVFVEPEAVVAEPEAEPAPEPEGAEDDAEAEEPAPTPIRWPKK